MTKRRVAVLMGGTSAEREVSLSTGRQILNALDPDKYIVCALDTATGRKFLPAVGLEASLGTLHAADRTTEIQSLPQLPLVAPEERPDVVFIALHGPGGEDGTVQGMLEVLGLPYTGSGVLASALAMDKAMCKRVLTSVGVRMPQDVTIRQGDKRPPTRSAALVPPVIVKPNRQGSTIGMSIVRDPSELEQALLVAFGHDDTALVEQFITGTEITVPILGNDDLEVLPIVEIVPASGFYDYQAKYTPGATDEIVPARIPEIVAAEARRIACLCHRTLGCRGMSRTDMIVTSQNEVYTLEVNTIPGMTPTSLLPRSAQAAGLPFPRLLDRLIDLALERADPACPPHPPAPSPSEGARGGQAMPPSTLSPARERVGGLPPGRGGKVGEG
ncbi:MAG: D-alanine--D-alanine ligase [Armatimonadetes bacterium]|nr:D-alanine--D-alanine ligase [Armatimonadota bacterium]